MTEQQSPNDSPPEQEPASSPPPAQASSSGLEPNVAGALSYLFTFVTGIVFLLIEKEDKFVRFHAVQAIGLGVAWFAAWIIVAIVGIVLGGIISGLLWFLIMLTGFVIWLFMMFKAYQGQMVKLPIIGDIAEKESNKLQK